MNDIARIAAEKIVAGFHGMNRLLPLAGGIPQPIEQSDDAAVVVALEYLRLRRVLAGCHRQCCTVENCKLDGGPEHEQAFDASPICRTCNGSGMPGGVSGYQCPECGPGEAATTEAVRNSEEVRKLHAEGTVHR